MSANAIRKSNRTANKKESTMPTETNTQRLARLERAAKGQAHIAEKALDTYRKGLTAEIAPTRLAAQQHGAEVAMRNANTAAKAAKMTQPYPRVIGTLRALEGEVLAARAASAGGTPKPGTKAAKSRSVRRPKVTPDKVVVESATPAAKPAKAAVKKAAPQPDSTSLDKGTQPKAFALVDYLNGAGWGPATIREEAPLVVVHGEREGEALTAYFIDNKQAPAPHPMPTFTRTDGSVVKLRNISAVRQQADTTATARPVKAVRTTVVRTRKADETTLTAEAARGLDIDIKHCGVEDLNKYLADRKVWWRRSETNGGGIVEARVWKVTKVQDTRHGRIVEFIEAMPTKRGWTSGVIRTVALKRLRLA
jgi:hypothetical protein